MAEHCNRYHAGPWFLVLHATREGDIYWRLQEFAPKRSGADFCGPYLQDAMAQRICDDLNRQRFGFDHLRVLQALANTGRRTAACLL